MAHVTEEKMRETVRPLLGSGIADGTPLAARLAAAVCAFAPFRESLDDLAEKLSGIFFNTLYETLGERMTLCLDNGQFRRIHISDLPGLADEAMGALFESMEVYSVNYHSLKEYSMRTGSLSAMRVLYQKYSQFQSDEERALLGRIIRESFPPERCQAWLAADSKS